MSVAKITARIRNSAESSYATPSDEDLFTDSRASVTEVMRARLTIPSGGGDLPISTFTSSSAATVMVFNRETVKRVQMTYRDMSGAVGSIQEIGPERVMVLPGVDPAADLSFALVSGFTGTAQVDVLVLQ